MTKVHAVCNLVGYRFGLEFQSELFMVAECTATVIDIDNINHNSPSTHILVLHFTLERTHHESCSTILFLNQCYTWKIGNGTFIYIYYRLLIHSSHCFTGKLSIKIHSNYNGASEHALLDSNPDFAYFLLVLNDDLLINRHQHL